MGAGRGGVLKLGALLDLKGIARDPPLLRSQEAVMRLLWVALLSAEN